MTRIPTRLGWLVLALLVLLLGTCTYRCARLDRPMTPEQKAAAMGCLR